VVGVHEALDSSPSTAKLKNSNWPQTNRAEKQTDTCVFVLKIIKHYIPA
jgi:hypothetical protein